MRRLLAGALAVLVFLALGATTALGARPDVDFASDLSGGQEVPPVDTPATGGARFDVVQLDSGEVILKYRLQVHDIDHVTASHIHLGCPGENGPVVAFLFEGGPTGPVDGMLATGTIRGDDLVGPLEGRRVQALTVHMRDGCTYTNVHTTEHPGGEIRGQIFHTGAYPP
jgi:hypothetical protein